MGQEAGTVEWAVKLQVRCRKVWVSWLASRSRKFRQGKVPVDMARASSSLLLCCELPYSSIIMAHMSVSHSIQADGTAGEIPLLRSPSLLDCSHFD